MTKVALLYGGASGEHEVSCTSALNIFKAIDKALYSIQLVGIAKNGRWHLQDPSTIDCEHLPEPRLPINIAGPQVICMPGFGLGCVTNGRVNKIECDMVFPILHGDFGEDGAVQGLLYSCGLPYVGADILGSAMCYNKHYTKLLCKAAEIPVLMDIVVSKSENREDPRTAAILAESVTAALGWPVFVKPTSSGSSMGACKVQTSVELSTALAEALRWSDTALIEPFAHAREIECAVLGNQNPRAFPPGEVVPKGEFYSYELKYVDPEGAGLVVPATLGREAAEQVMSYSRRAYSMLGLRGMARIDFFLVESAVSGSKVQPGVYLNEVNTIPGFTNISMYPRMCTQGGLTYTELISKLIELGLE